MRKTANALLILALAISLIGPGQVTDAQARVVLESSGPRHHGTPSHNELVIEGGLTEPWGDQKDSFWSTDTGFDASTGYQFGIRLRQFLGGSLVVAPAFHYTRLGDADGVGDFGGADLLGYRLSTSFMRYGLDLQAFLGDPASQVRPYLTGGVALIHNRYRDELQYGGTFETSMNSPGLSLGFGVRMGNLELSAEYTYNRFSTANLTPEIGSQDYNWDVLVVRLGVALGR